MASWTEERKPLVKSKTPIPHPYEAFRDREYDRDELQDRLDDEEWNREHSRAAPSGGSGDGYW